MEKTNTITRRIQLLIDSKDPQTVRKAWAQLYQWQDICYRAANMIMSHQFVQEQLKDFFYLTEGTKLKLADQKRDAAGMLQLSREGSTYHVLSRHFKGQVPMNILSNLNHSLLASFNREKDAYWKGEKSLRSYRKHMPMPFGAEVLCRLAHAPEQGEFCFTLFQIPFRTYLGRDSADKKAMMERIRTGALQLRASQLQLQGGKLFLLAAVRAEREQHTLDPAVIAEASLSIESPISVRIGRHELAIGSREEFLHQRLAIRAAIQRVRRASAFNRGGHGKKRKMKAMDNYRQLEKRVVAHKLHLYSRMLVNFCTRHRAATLLLVNQQAKEQIAREDPFLLRHWSYFGLKEKICYKAEKAGIQVIIE